VKTESHTISLTYTFHSWEGAGVVDGLDVSDVQARLDEVLSGDTVLDETDLLLLGDDVAGVQFLVDDGEDGLGVLLITKEDGVSSGGGDEVARVAGEGQVQVVDDELGGVLKGDVEHVGVGGVRGEREDLAGGGVLLLGVVTVDVVRAVQDGGVELDQGGGGGEAESLVVLEELVLGDDGVASLEVSNNLGKVGGDLRSGEDEGEFLVGFGEDDKASGGIVEADNELVAVLSGEDGVGASLSGKGVEFGLSGVRAQVVVVELHDDGGSVDEGDDGVGARQSGEVLETTIVGGVQTVSHNNVPLTLKVSEGEILDGRHNSGGGDGGNKASSNQESHYCILMCVYLYFFFL